MTKVIKSADFNKLKSLKDQIALRESQIHEGNCYQYHISTSNSFKILRTESDEEDDNSHSPHNSLIDSNIMMLQDDSVQGENQAIAKAILYNDYQSLNKKEAGNINAYMHSTP